MLEWGGKMDNSHDWEVHRLIKCYSTSSGLTSAAIASKYIHDIDNNSNILL